jgi:hypothetical protein
MNTMKNIKPFLLIVISTFAASVLYAQNPDAKQRSPAPAPAPTVSPEIKKAPAATLSTELKQVPAAAPELKVLPAPSFPQTTEKPVTADEKMEDAKPVLMPSGNMERTPEIKTEPRQSAVNRMPVIPPPVGNIAPPPAPAKKPVPVQQQ